MSRLPFGTPVTFPAIVEPRYLKWQTETIAYEPVRFDGFRLGHEVTLDPPALVCNDREWEPIGDPLPGTADVPAGSTGVHRRLRRFPVSGGTGLVVGWTFRIEGEHYAQHSSHNPYTGEHDYEPGGIAETGRYWLYQVAVDTGDGTRHAAPAHVVLVYPTDAKAAA
jgi:hypothetical protein